ncbi:hypothetical protein DFP72DRAFT_1078228 [Ephemerocybe angulata]|uniref:F-box domain-containing protein n=1 Tax=Ephemerocybe angulata TaxID=980116 RepID=A0A8H6HCR3_9AGAR|nr:hypothetical protein DFP72DRAFT_1078228 [Tulosesus angulatus]
MEAQSRPEAINDLRLPLPTEFGQWNKFPPELVRETVQHMDFEQLTTFRSTSRIHDYETNKVLEERVDAQLTHFGLEKGRIFEIMTKRHAFISGSVALVVLFPGEAFIPGDIDFYVGEEYHDQFVNDVLSSTKYTETPLPSGTTTTVLFRDGYPLENAGIKSVKWLQHAEKKTKMNIIQIELPEVMAAVFQFYSTLLMNVITPVGVGCGYPRLTMKKAGVLKERPMEKAHKVALNQDKYWARGFDIWPTWTCEPVKRLLAGHKQGDKCCPQQRRTLRTKDGFLWMSFKEDRGVDLKLFLPDIAWLNDPKSIVNDNSHTCTN